MVATTAKKTPKSPAKKVAGKPAPIIGKGKLDSPLSSPTPSQRSRGRITVKSPEPADSDGDARSPTKRLTPGRGAKTAAIALLAEQGKYELDTDAHGEAKSKRGRAPAKDDDFDVAMEEQDPFADDDDDFEASPKPKRPPRSRSGVGTPRCESPRRDPISPIPHRYRTISTRPPLGSRRGGLGGSGRPPAITMARSFRPLSLDPTLGVSDRSLFFFSANPAVCPSGGR